MHHIQFIIPGAHEEMERLTMYSMRTHYRLCHISLPAKFQGQHGGVSLERLAAKGGKFWNLQ